MWGPLSLLLIASILRLHWIHRFESDPTPARDERISSLFPSTDRYFRCSFDASGDYRIASLIGVYAQPYTSWRLAWLALTE